MDGYPKRPKKGLSYTEIARKYHIDRRTAKKYAESSTRLVYSLRSCLVTFFTRSFGKFGMRKVAKQLLSNTKPSKLGPYKEQITGCLEEAPYSAERILEKIWDQRFEGGHSIVLEYVRNKKEQPMRFHKLLLKRDVLLYNEKDWSATL